MSNVVFAFLINVIVTTLIAQKAKKPPYASVGFIKRLAVAFIAF